MASTIRISAFYVATSEQNVINCSSALLPTVFQTMLYLLNAVRIAVARVRNGALCRWTIRAGMPRWAAGNIGQMQVDTSMDCVGPCSGKPGETKLGQCCLIYTSSDGFYTNHDPPQNPPQTTTLLMRSVN